MYCENGKEKHRTSNVQLAKGEQALVRLWRIERRMGKVEESNIGFMKTNGIKLRSAATSLFDVQRWMFDVRRSSLITILYGII